MQANLIQTEKCDIVYGTFQGKENQELFRCARELEDLDLRSYVNRECIFLGVEEDNVEDLRKVDGKKFLGYYRMYFSNGSWYGRWLDTVKDLEQFDAIGIQDILDWIHKTFTSGCNYTMKEYLEQFNNWGSENRYLLKPIMSDKFKIMIDTTYGNSDYPIRIYVYGKEN